MGNVTRRWRKRIAIVGIGESDLGTVPGKDSFELSRQALMRALEDCGIDKNEIDGVMTTENERLYKTASRDQRKNPSYWDGCKRGKLLLPKCRACGNIFFFPNNFCMECLSEDIEWIESSGKGTVHTFSIIQRPPSDAFAADVPYVVALIDLEEGSRMMSNLVGIQAEQARVGMPVNVVFEKVTEEITIPKFRPA